MIQEQKELLLKDLCARLPYGTRIYAQNADDWYDDEISTQVLSDVINEDYIVKPYLFPLSSMTEEQRFEVSKILGKDVVIFSDYLLTINNCRKSFSYQELDTLFNWFDKNHFDYRGLIPMGLALDATGKNIY